MIFEKIREKMIAKRDSICKTKNDCIALSDAEVNGVTFANFDDAIDIVNQVEADYNNGWIPCSERLPEDCSSVICSLKLKNKAMYSINALWYNRELKKWCDIETDEPFVEKLFEVTAWQPLPEPYKPREEQPTEPEWKSSVMNHFMKGE